MQVSTRSPSPQRPATVSASPLSTGPPRAAQALAESYTALVSGVLIGMAQAGTTYAVIYGVIGRNVSADKRSWAMGVAAAAGSFGQFLMVPVETWLIDHWGWPA